jgi:hypothetical protein
MLTGGGIKHAGATAYAEVIGWLICFGPHTIYMLEPVSSSARRLIARNEPWQLSTRQT